MSKNAGKLFFVGLLEALTLEFIIKQTMGIDVFTNGKYHAYHAVSKFLLITRLQKYLFINNIVLDVGKKLRVL